MVTHSQDWQFDLSRSIERAKLESFLFSGEDQTEAAGGREDLESATDGESASDAQEEDASANGTLGSLEDTAKRGTAGQEKMPVWVDAEQTTHNIDIASSRMGRAIQGVADKAIITGIEYEKRLRRHHEKIHPRISWADPSKALRKVKRQKLDMEGAEEEEEEEEDSEDDHVQDLLVSAQPFLGKSQSLPKRTIQMSPMSDANRNARTFGFVNSIHFQPKGQLMLTCGKDKRLHLFSIDGAENPKVQTVHFEDMKVWKAAFGALGDQVLVTGIGKRYCYTYNLHAGHLQKISSPQVEGCPKLSDFSVSTSMDLPLAALHGREGNVTLFSMKSHQWIGSLKMNSGDIVESSAFSASGLELYTAGSGGRVHVWDLRMRRCLHRFADEGSLRCTSLALCPNNQYFAAGSEMGVVNIYDHGACAPQTHEPRPSPLRALTNLTTAINILEFNPDSQILAVGSQKISGSLRLVHLPSCTVFQNWPAQSSPLANVSCAAFSPGGCLFAVGNSKGKVLLYRMHHYNNV